MVQGIDNLTQLAGTMVARRAHPELREYDLVTLDVENVKPVDGRANLITEQAGSRIEVTIRHELLGAAAEGAGIRCRVKRTLDGIMCEPHPDAGNFKIE